MWTERDGNPGAYPVTPFAQDGGQRSQPISERSDTNTRTKKSASTWRSTSIGSARIISRWRTRKKKTYPRRRRLSWRRSLLVVSAVRRTISNTSATNVTRCRWTASCKSSSVKRKKSNQIWLKKHQKTRGRLSRVTLITFQIAKNSQRIKKKSWKGMMQILSPFFFFLIPATSDTIDAMRAHFCQR